MQLFQIPQRYRFSSKSQHLRYCLSCSVCCFRYHKGTDFQANHNHLVLINLATLLFQIPQRYRFSSKSQLISVRICNYSGCFRYHKGTDFQANHNYTCTLNRAGGVVLDTTKVQIFKQITTQLGIVIVVLSLFQIPQRYRFSSKSQRVSKSSFRSVCCFRYHKGTDFQANHNHLRYSYHKAYVVLDTTKVQIFKQITT